MGERRRGALGGVVRPRAEPLGGDALQQARQRQPRSLEVQRGT